MKKQGKNQNTTPPPTAPDPAENGTSCTPPAPF